MQARPDPVRDAALFKQFAERVNQYIDLHKRLKKEGPPLKDKAEPEEIKASTEALRARIQAARSRARPGDVLMPELRPVFRRILRSELTGPGSADARDAVLVEGNPKVEGPRTPLVVKVNAVYPSAAALSTVPPTILLKLPKLPDEILEYRFVGRDMILRDVAADLIVDFMKGAVP